VEGEIFLTPSLASAAARTANPSTISAISQILIPWTLTGIYKTGEVSDRGDPGIEVRKLTPC
jgi:hypothetical protein